MLRPKVSTLGLQIGKIGFFFAIHFLGARRRKEEEHNDVI